MIDKQHLIDAAKTTFFSYLKLDFAREFLLTFEDRESSLSQYIQYLIETGISEHNCTINNTNYIIKIDNDTVELTRPVPLPAQQDLEVKDVKHYTQKEAVNLLSNTRFKIMPGKNGKISLGLPVTIRESTYTLGGPKKLDLYRSHLVTLLKKIEHLESTNDDVPMLVALTTGAGKTFDQALWYLTLQIANMSGIFALPDHLVTQLFTDFKRLLPDELVDEFIFLRKDSSDFESEAASEAIKHLPKKRAANYRRGSIDGDDFDTATPIFILASYEGLLDDHFTTLLNADPARVALSFDEQHLAMSDERRRVRLKELAKHLPSLFLTATPNEETFEMCDGKPVAVMSALRKQHEGQGDFPVIHKLRAKSFQRKMQMTEDFTLKERFVNKLVLLISDALEPIESSPMMTALQELQHHTHFTGDPTPENVRHTLQMPIKRKMLVLTDKVEELVNVKNFVQANYKVYMDGNLRDRDGLSRFLSIRPPDDDIDDKFKAKLRAAYNDQTQGLRDDNQLLNGVYPHLYTQIEKNIYHNIVDLFLSDLTGLSVIELNKLRRDNLDTLHNLASQAYITSPHADNDYKQYWIDKLTYTENNKTGIDAGRAADIAEIMCEMKNKFATLTQTDKKTFVDNWPFDTELHDNIYTHFRKLKNFTNNHKTMYVMTGMENAEIPIEDGRVFFDFNRNWHYIHDEKGMLTPEAKKVKRSALKSLEAYSQEVTYTPQYDDTLTEAMADNLFKLGLVGMYVSNKKGEGFNDLNLHTVINAIPSSDDKHNAPHKMIQINGRPRGLDPTVRDYLVEVTGEDTKTSFDVSLLERTDEYYPLYFKAEKKYKKIYLQRLARHIVEDIRQWHQANVNELNEADPVALKWQTLRNIVSALRLLNNQNSHNINVSRAQLKTLLKFVKKEINNGIDDVKTPFKSNPLIKAIAPLFLLLCNTIHLFKHFKTHVKFYFAYREARLNRWRNPENEQHKAEVVYGKIIVRMKFRKLIREAMVAREFYKIITREERAVASLALNHLNDDKKEEINNTIKENLLPLLLQFYDPSLHESLTTAANEYNQWHLAFYKHKEALTSLKDKLSGDIMSSWNAELESELKSLAKNILSECPDVANILCNTQPVETLDFTQLISVLPLAKKAPGLANKLKNEFLQTQNYDEGGLNQMIQDRFKKTILHPRFYKFCKRTFSKLQPDELLEIIKVIRPKEEPETLRDKLVEFIEQLRRKDYQSIADKLMQIDTDEDNLLNAVQHIKLSKIVELIKDITGEIINIQGDYNSMDARGLCDNNKDSKLWNHLNEQGAEVSKYVTTGDRYSVIDIMTRRVFYLHGIVRGSSNANKISEFGDQPLLKDLNRVKDHIVLPLWWSANRTETAQRMAKAGRAFKAKLKSWFTPRARGYDPVEPELDVTPKQRDARYDAAAYDIGAHISRLQRFTLTDVQEEDCKIDTVQDVFDRIDENAPISVSVR